jgi:aminopeptidase N
VVTEAKRRFNLYISGEDKPAIHPSLRTAVYGIAIREGGEREFTALKREWYETQSIDGKEIILRALGRLQKPELLSQYLELLFKEVPSQDVHTGAFALSANPKTRAQLWSYIQENFDTLKTKLSANMVVFDRFLNLSLQRFNDKETEQEIAKFFDGMDNRGYDRTLGILHDTILGRAAYKERDGPIILEWLKTNGFA